MAVVLVGCGKPPAGIDNGSNASEVVGKPLGVPKRVFATLAPSTVIALYTIIGGKANMHLASFSSVEMVLCLPQLHFMLCFSEIHLDIHGYHEFGLPI